MPDQPQTQIETLLNQANTALQQGNMPQAEQCYHALIQAGVQHPDIYNNLGIACKQQGKLSEAEAMFRQALVLKPDFIQGHLNLSVTLYEQQRYEDTIACLQQALTNHPDIAPLHLHLANALHKTGKLEEAIASYQQAITLQPDLIAAHHNLGNLFRETGRLEEAVAAYETVLTFNPQVIQSLFALGNICAERGLSEEAIQYYERALEVQPDFAEAATHLLHEYQKICAWDKMEALHPKVESFTQAALDASRVPAHTPFTHLCISTNAEENLKVASAWSSQLEHAIQPLKETLNFQYRKHGDKLTIGYISNRFSDTATGHNLCRIFGLHNRDDFTIHCYSYGPDDSSAYRKTIEENCESFVDITGMSDEEAARRIHDDKVDILVELKGYTRDNRLAISALKPSPIIINMLGHPGTTGAPWIDYILTDNIVIPPDHQRYYSESCLTMPDTYWPTDNEQTIAETSITRKDAGLPEENVVFCSFNRPFKIEPDIFTCWMTLLKEVENSVLWLYASEKAAIKHLQDAASEHGIDPTRLIFAEPIPKPEHLARLKLADIALDTHTYGGHTTTSDALWVGLPVITTAVESFTSRVCASILHAANLPELVTENFDSYTQTALTYAKHPEKLAELKTKLQENTATTPLFDTPSYVKHLEQGYRMAWERYMKGEQPTVIEIASSQE